MPVQYEPEPENVFEEFLRGKHIQEAIYATAEQAADVIGKALESLASLPPLPLAKDEERLRKALANLIAFARTTSKTLEVEIGIPRGPRRRGLYL